MDIENILYKKTISTPISFLLGCLILIDKPLHWTSFDVVNKIRFAIKHKYGVKKCKVGHAGTLDPLATGLLLVCTGPYTKVIDSFQNESKVYSGKIMLGAVTPTFDSESEPENFQTVPILTDKLVKEIENKFAGDILQFPPAYSAIKIQGKKSYELARKGIAVELKSRPVSIYKIELRQDGDNELNFVVHCSKGTYIRSLANDIGQYLGCGGYLKTLKRESISLYQLTDAVSIDEAVNNIQTLGSL